MTWRIRDASGRVIATFPAAVSGEIGAASQIDIYAGVVGYTSGDVEWRSVWDGDSGTPPALDSSVAPAGKVRVRVLNPALNGGGVGTATISALLDGVVSGNQITVTIDSDVAWAEA